MQNLKHLSLVGFGAGIAFMLVLLPAAAFVYLRLGNPPVAVADKPFPDEEQIVHIPLNARINRQMTKPPFSPTHEDFLAGANIYTHRCAVCHGTLSQQSEMSVAEYPTPPQLWIKRNQHGSLGVSDDLPGRIYWEVRNGIRLTGMPAFDRILDDKQMWQVTLLVHQAGQPLPADVLSILNDATLTTQHGFLSTSPAQPTGSR